MCAKANTHIAPVGTSELRGYSCWSQEVEAIEDTGEGVARGEEFLTQRADADSGGVGVEL